MGPEVLCPALLVFGAIPRPARHTTSPDQSQRSAAIQKAVEAAETEQARRVLAFGLRHKTGGKGKEMSERLLKLPAGSPVLVYRTKPKEWTGPHKFISVRGETAVVQLDRGRRIFRSTCVKPYTESAMDGRNDDLRLEANYSRFTGKEATEGHDFQEAKLNELKGLVDDGTFEVVKESDIPTGTRIFNSRFIDELKKADKGLRLKSRLIAQTYGDEEAASIATKSPTMQRFAQRVMMSIAASQKSMTLYTRDITQAYVQSRTKIERTVHLRPPMEMGLSEGVVLKVVKPLYGIPESGLHWYLTYLEHHMTKLGMRRSRTDPCLLLGTDADGLRGMIILQVDDSLGLGTDTFMEEEERASTEFRCKPRKQIKEGCQEFNGSVVSQYKNATITLTQEAKIQKLNIPTDEKAFISHRALAQYIGVSVRPDVCAPVQLVAPGNQPITKPEYSQLTRSIKFLKSTARTGLKFVPLDIDTMRVVIMSDASFANARGGKSQLGFVIAMVDKNNRANIVHYASCRCRRVARSVMAAEIHALVTAFDFAFVIADMLGEIMSRQPTIEALVDSRTLFDVIAKAGKTAERRLQIDVLAIKE